MPTPVGHSLIGLSLGVGFLLPRSSFRSLWREAWKRRGLFFMVLLLANLPDIDFIPGIVVGDLNAYHHQQTHTLLFTVAGSALVLVLWWRWHPPVTRTLLLLVPGLLFSHLVADWMCKDLSFPYGIMWLWPLSEAYTLAPWTPFLPVRKDTYSTMLDMHNVLVVLVEVAWTLPILLAVCWTKTGRRVVPAFHAHET